MKEINIVQIQSALLLPLTGQFIVDKLEVKPVRQEKRAMYWKATDFTNICQGLISHITAARNADFDTISAERPKKAEPAAEAPAGSNSEDFFAQPSEQVDDFFA